MFSFSYLVMLCFLTHPSSQDVFTGIVDQVNQLLVENHLDGFDLRLNTRFSWFIFSLEIEGIHFGNFSTLALYNVPVIHRLDEKNSTYQIKLQGGWPMIKAGLDYRTGVFLFSSSGKVILYDTGITLQFVGEIVEENGACKFSLSDVELEDLGKLKLTTEPNSINNWLIKKLAEIGLSIFNDSLMNVIRNPIQDILRLYMSDFRLIGIEIPCSYINLYYSNKQLS